MCVIALKQLNITPEKAKSIQNNKAPSQDEILELSRYQTKEAIKWGTELGEVTLKKILRAKTPNKGESEHISELSGNELLGKAFLLNKDGKFARALKQYKITTGNIEGAKLASEEDISNHQLDPKCWVNLWDFYQKLYKAVGLYETLEGDEKVTYTKNSRSIKSFIKWIEKNRSWLECTVSLPPPEKLKDNPLRYIGTWLDRSGLKHERVGKAIRRVNTP